MKKLNVGIIGYGWASGAHIDAINATTRARVTHLYSSRALDTEQLRSRDGGALKVFSDMNGMLAQADLDVVSICSYPHLHVQHAIAAAGAGKHLIIEKPLALSWEDCRAIGDAVKAAGVRTCVCFECRYSSQFLTIKAVIERGLLGRIHYGEVDYYHGIGPWYGQYRWNITRESGGSSLLSAGCHALDGLLHCMGSDVESVWSVATYSSHPAFAKYQYPTTSVTLLRFRDGRLGKCVSCIDCLQPYYFHTHLVGSEGSLLDNRFYSTQLGGLNKARWSELSMKLLDSGDVSDHPYQNQFEAFFEALDGDREMPLTNLDAALKTHRILFAADRSAREGKPVVLD